MKFKPRSQEYIGKGSHHSADYIDSLAKDPEGKLTKMAVKINSRRWRNEYFIC